MSSDVLDSLARWVKTAPGRRWFEGVDREGKARDAVIARRREVAAKITEARRAQREDVPKLEAVAKQADAELAVARVAFEKAKHKRHETGWAAHNLHMRCYEEMRRSQSDLRRTCDPRLNEIEERLGDARRDWDRTWDKLAIRETVGEFMEAYTRIVNQAELEALHQGLRDTAEAIDKFKLVPEPPEDEVLRVVAQGGAALDAIRAAGGGDGREVVQ